MQMIFVSKRGGGLKEIERGEGEKENLNIFGMHGWWEGVAKEISLKMVAVAIKSFSRHATRW
jgi:hypothetical protein